MYLVLALAGLLSLGFMFHTIVFYIWSNIFVISKINPEQMGEGFYFYYIYIYILEIGIVILVRTRISIIYFSRIITIINILYLFYCFSNIFPFVSLATTILLWSTLTILLIFAKCYEIPAIRRNPFINYNPSITNPRQAYQHTLASMFSIGLNIWSIFYAPSLSSEFNEAENPELEIEIGVNQFDFSESIDEEVHNEIIEV